ncbi:MAG: hypothetical protein IJO98_05945 [Clostridia bacterium]|nr:hypothetical protein [Clostridia bacterium]
MGENSFSFRKKQKSFPPHPLSEKENHSGFFNTKSGLPWWQAGLPFLGQTALVLRLWEKRAETVANLWFASRKATRAVKSKI